MGTIQYDMITVIIPTYGQPVFLKNAIESVIRQSYRDWELIIVDDNNPVSKDRIATAKIVENAMSSDYRIHYIQHPRNLNGATARNTGLKAAKGEYISFLDSDDEYMQDRLEKCLKALNDLGPECAGVFTGCEFRRHGKTYLNYKGVKSGRHLVETLAGNFMFCTGSNLFVRHSVIKELNGFDESFLRHQDYEFLVRLFDKYSLVAIPEILVIKNNENFNVPQVEKMIAIKQQYLNKYKYLIEGLPDEDIKFIYHTNAVAIGELALQNGRRSLSKEYYDTAKSYSKLTLKEQLRRFAFRILSYKNGNQTD